MTAVWINLVFMVAYLVLDRLFHRARMRQWEEILDARDNLLRSEFHLAMAKHGLTEDAAKFLVIRKVALGEPKKEDLS